MFPQKSVFFRIFWKFFAICFLPIKKALGGPFGSQLLGFIFFIWGGGGNPPPTLGACYVSAKRFYS